MEWLYAVFDWTPVWRRRFKGLARSRYAEDGQRNAASIVEGDGLRMLQALGDVASYRGAVPLWTQLELRKDPRNDCAMSTKAITAGL